MMRWTAEQDAALRRLWREGLSSPAISYGIFGNARHHSRVRARAQRLGLDPRRAYRKPAQPVPPLPAPPEPESASQELQQPPLPPFPGQCWTGGCRNTAQPGRYICAECNAKRFATARALRHMDVL